MLKSKLLIGVYVSLKAPDYLQGSLDLALKYGSNSFMIFTSSPRTSASRNTSLFKIDDFKHQLTKTNIDLTSIVVHGSYLINLANTKDSAKLAWSIKLFKEEIARMEAIGLKTLIIHPGSSLGEDREQSIINIAESLNKLINQDSNLRIALETMSGRTNEIGSTFDELKMIIDNVRFSEKIGVCWDTCHLYSAGYDIKNNLELVIEEFKSKIGLSKLWAIHLNDSCYELGARKDRHQYIGEGYIGFEALKKIIHHSDFQNIVKILEMPLKEDFDEIKRLRA